MTERNAGKEKGTKDGRYEAKAPMRLKVEQIETKVQLGRTGGDEGPRSEKEWQKERRGA